MKPIRSSVIIILFILTSSLCAERPICEVTAFCYSMSAKDANEFTLTYNPAGQAGYSMDQLDTWVTLKKARSLGSLSTKGKSGLHLRASGKEFSLETETIVSSDASLVDIISKTTLGDQTVVSNAVCNNTQFVFAGNSTPQDHGFDADGTVYFVYLLSKITKQ